MPSLFQRIAIRKTLRDLINKFTGEWLEQQAGWFGDTAGVVDAGHGMVNVLLHNGNVVQAVNKVTGARPNKPVVIGRSRTLPTIWQVIKVRDVFDVEDTDDTVPYHYKQHMFGAEDQVPIHRKQITQLTVVTLPSSGPFYVRVYGDVRLTSSGNKKIATQPVNLASYVPATGAIYVNIESDGNGVLSVHVGTGFDAPSIATAADMPAPVSGKHVRAHVLLYEGQAALKEKDITVPMPVDFNPLDVAGISHVHLLDDLSDVNAPAPTDVQVLTYDVYAEEWIANNLDTSMIHMPKVGSPTTIDFLDEDHNTHFSSGVADGTLTYVQVDTGAHKIKVLAGEGYLRTTNDQQGVLVAVAWALTTQIDIPVPAAGQETTRFIGIEYNSGSPQVTSRTTFNWNWYNDFPLARVSYDGTTLHILNAYAHCEDTANLTRKFLRLVFPFQRESAPEGTGGLELSEVATRQLAMSAGNVWHGFNQYALSAVSAGTTFDIHYRDGAGGFVNSSGTQYPNTQYDDGSGTLATMTNNKYACLWVYLDVSDGTLNVIIGRGEYNQVADADLEAIPTTPAHLTYHGRLIARITFQKSAASASSIQSAWQTTFSGGTVFDLASAIMAATIGATPDVADWMGYVVDTSGALRRIDFDALINNLLASNLASYFADVIHGHSLGNNQIDHDDLSDIGINNHDAIDTHIASTSNPHGVTAAQAVAIPQDGWIAGTGTWSYTSADTPTFVASVPDADAALMQPGYRIKLTQTTAKYFIVHTKGTPSGGFTPVTIYGGTDYTLANAAISSQYFSPVKSPFGFPMSPAKWTVTVTDSNACTKTSPAASTWYGGTGLSATGPSIDIPIGVWLPSYVASVRAITNLAAVGNLGVQITLSTANNSESDSANSRDVLSTLPISAAAAFRISVNATLKPITLATKTTHYLNVQTSQSSVSSISILGTVLPTRIDMLCAYL